MRQSSPSFWTARKTALIAAVIAIAAVWQIVLHRGPSGEQCDRETVGSLPSPNQSRIAYMQKEICSAAMFATTGVAAVVQVAGTAEKSTSDDDVFAVDYHGHPSTLPKLAWLSETQLKITVPNTSLIGLEKKSHGEVDIQISYEPDDPEERARFLESLGLAKK